MHPPRLRSCSRDGSNRLDNAQLSGSEIESSGAGFSGRGVNLIEIKVDFGALTTGSRAWFFAARGSRRSCALGVEREMASSSSFMSAGMSAKSGVLR